MNLFPSRKTGLKTLGLALAGLALCAGAAYAQTAAAPAAPPAPVPNKGDTAWMLTSSALVLMMSIPGLALFYGGLVRTKNMLSVLTQVFAIVSLVGVVWVLYGYSEAFTNGGALNDFVGGFSKSFLKGVDVNSTAATFSNGVVIPEYAYMVFQMTFAMITPALIVGAFAERIKFSAVMLFVLLWVTLIYFPIAQWSGIGPARTPSAMRRALWRRRPTTRPRLRLRPSLTRPISTPASCSSLARSTSPAARWCTSTPASPASSAPS